MSRRWTCPAEGWSFFVSADADVRRGAAGREPRGDGVGGVPRERNVIGGITALIAAADRGVGPRLVAEGAGEAALFVEVPLAPALGVLVEAEETETEFAADEDMVVVELVAKVVPRADDGFGGGGSCWNGRDGGGRG